MKTSKRTPRRIANDAPTKLKHEIWRWSAEQDELKLGPKAFLNHLADHADHEARVFVISRHFQKLMNVSPRSITNYLRKLEAHEMIVKTGDFIVLPRVHLPLYRLAPRDPVITELAGSEHPADLQGHEQRAQLGNLDGETCASGSQRSKTDRAYKNNSNIQVDNQKDATARSGGNAGPGVQKVEAGEHSRAASAIPIEPVRIPPPAKPQTAHVPDWLRKELLQALGEDWAASNLEACGWMEVPDRLCVPDSKAHNIFQDAQQVLAKHNIKVVATRGR